MLDLSIKSGEIWMQYRLDTQIYEVGQVMATSAVQIYGEISSYQYPVIRSRYVMDI